MKLLTPIVICRNDHVFKTNGDGTAYNDDSCQKRGQLQYRSWRRDSYMAWSSFNFVIPSNLIHRNRTKRDNTFSSEANSLELGGAF